VVYKKKHENNINEFSVIENSLSLGLRVTLLMVHYIQIETTNEI